MRLQRQFREKDENLNKFLYMNFFHYKFNNSGAGSVSLLKSARKSVQTCQNLYIVFVISYTCLYFIYMMFRVCLIHHGLQGLFVPSIKMFSKKKYLESWKGLWEGTLTSKNFNFYLSNSIYLFEETK